MLGTRVPRLLRSINVALKSTYASEEKGAEIEEALDVLDKLVDRVKVLYEQYFMGIQKQAPAHLHTEAERRLRDLTQMNIRNTALRYRFSTLQQKYGSYNTYWKRTLREIEGGRYLRSLSKLRRQAQMTGEDIPEEILAKMPRRMRDAVARDREVAVAKAVREGRLRPDPGPGNGEASEASDASDAPDTQPDVQRFPAPPALPRPMRAGDSHQLENPFAGGEGDIADMLTALADEALAAVETRIAPPVTRPPPSRRAPIDTTPSPPPRPATATVAPPPRPAAATVAPPPRPATATIAPPPRPAATRTVASPIPGMSEADTRSLYARYVKAREVVGDKTDPMSYDKLLRTLSSQAPKIIEQHKAKGVEFNVVIKDNKVVLKAKPK